MDTFLGPVRLRDASTEAIFGGKAVKLGVALRENLPVPDGWAIPAPFAARIGQGDETAKKILRDLPIDPDMAIAVRSSAVGEDSAEASFAGQYETHLNVRFPDGVVDAVAAVWRSAQSDAVKNYREKMGLPSSAEIGVVLQQLIDPDTAGVLFTENPVTGAKEYVIEASFGFGEAVVSGLVTPDLYRMERDGTIIEQLAGNKDVVLRRSEGGGLEEAGVGNARADALCLAAKDLAELRSLAMRCEEVFACACDIEWAVVGDKMVLLQCRAVTGPSASRPGG